MTLSEPGNDGFDSIALTYRSSVKPGSITMSFHQSGPVAATVTGSGVEITRSGGPMVHSFAAANVGGAGRSAGLPRGAPASIHRAMVAISASASDRSSLNFWIPTFRSMYQGGISRVDTFCRIDRAQGRASSYVSNDIGAIEP